MPRLDHCLPLVNDAEILLHLNIHLKSWLLGFSPMLTNHVYFLHFICPNAVTASHHFGCCLYMVFLLVYLTWTTRERKGALCFSFRDSNPQLLALLILGWWWGREHHVCVRVWQRILLYHNMQKSERRSLGRGLKKYTTTRRHPEPPTTSASSEVPT